MAEASVTINNVRWYYDTVAPAAVTRIFMLAGSSADLVIPDHLVSGIDVTGIANGIGDYTNERPLTSITFPETLQYIGARAFADNSGSMDIHIPASVTTIGAGFIDSSLIRNIYFHGNMPTVGTQVWPLNHLGNDAEVPLGHAYVASNFPLPGEYFHGLLMGAQIDGIPPASSVRVKPRYKDYLAPRYFPIKEYKLGNWSQSPAPGIYPGGIILHRIVKNPEYDLTKNFIVSTMVGIPYPYYAIYYLWGFSYLRPYVGLNYIDDFAKVSTNTARNSGMLFEFIPYAGPNYGLIRAIYNGTQLYESYLGKWYANLSITYDGTTRQNGAWRFYVDGVFKAGVTATTDPYPYLVFSANGYYYTNQIAYSNGAGSDNPPADIWEVTQELADPGSGITNVRIRGKSDGISPNVKVIGV